MKGKKKDKAEVTHVNEPDVTYGHKLSVTTLAALSEKDRQTTRNMTHEERMEYLLKLISITHSADDLSAAEKAFYDGKIRINKTA